MVKMFTAGIICLLLSIFNIFTTTTGEPIEKVEGESYQAMLLRLAHMIEDNPEYKKEWDERVKLADELVLPPIVFDCEVETSPEIPTSVHMLRPSDIKVIGAFGDSISAGNGLGARNPPEVAVENRGEVFTVGGDESIENDVITLTNFIRKFNPDLKGYSYCESTRDNYKRSWLNVAEPGGDNRDMPPQANMIIDRMKSDSRIDFENDWKLISLFVGGNDLCASCRRSEFFPEAYGAKFREAVDILHDNVPRLLVQLIVMFDVTPLTNLSTGLLCDALQINFCDCAVNETTKLELRNTQMAYFRQLEAITEDEKYRDREDFAVVLQPQMRDMIPPIDPDTGKYMLGFLAPDCFHPNRLSHQTFAFFLWNTMLTPVGQKPTTIDTDPSGIEYMEALCPSEKHPYIFTHGNSDVEWP